MCSQEEAATLLLASLFRSIVGSHCDLCAAVRVASFLARFLRPRAFFPLGIGAGEGQSRRQKCANDTELSLNLVESNAPQGQFISLEFRKKNHPCIFS